MPDPEFNPMMTAFRWRWFQFCCIVATTWLRICYGLKYSGRENRVAQGPVLYVSNHQSFLDPIILSGITFPRPFFSMARATLWDHKLVGKLISSLSAIPVNQEASDIKSMRRCASVLKNGESLELYPEGARTLDGEVHEFARGIMLLIKLGQPTVVPIGIQGAHKVWPRGQKPRWFGGGPIRAKMGQPIAAQTLLDMKSQEAVAYLEKQVRDLVESITD